MKNKPMAAQDANPQRWKQNVTLIIILLISCIVYFPVLKNGFVWDDQAYIVNNYLIKDLSWHGIKAIFGNFSGDNYAPMTDLINAVQYKISGLSPAAFHFGSLVFHLLNTALVFLFIKLLSNSRNIAAITALFFGIHPVQVESVAWASGGSTLFCAAFFLGSLIAYLYYLRKHLKRYLFISLIFLLLSLLSKAVAVVLPVILFLIDYYKNRKITIKNLLEKVPFLMLALGAGIFSMLLKYQPVYMENLPVYSFPQRIIFASCGFITYLLKLILPLHLSAYYPFPVKSGESIPVLYYSYALIFSGVVACVIYSARFTKNIVFGVGFFFVTIFLLLQLLPFGGVIMADRYCYLPSVGIFFLAGEGYLSLSGKKLKPAAIILLTVYAVFFMVTTYTRCSVWKNDLTLWNDVIDQYQTVPVAYNNRGTLLLNEERNDEALNNFTKAIELKPDYTDAYYNRGNLLMDAKRYDEALIDFNKVIELNPRYVDGYYRRGCLFMNEKRNEEALKDLNKTIELKPGYADAYNNRGLLFMIETRFDEALKDFTKAIELNPGYAGAYNNLGSLFFKEKRYEEAIRIYTEAIALENDNAQAYYNRGIAEFYSGHKDAACTDLKQAAGLGFPAAADAISRICN